jgi:hypothetical protein
MTGFYPLAFAEDCGTRRKNEGFPGCPDWKELVVLKESPGGI